MKAQVLLPKVFNFPFTYESKIEGKIGNQVLLYFRRIMGRKILEIEFSPEEKAKLQKLAPEQRP